MPGDRSTCVERSALRRAGFAAGLVHILVSQRGRVAVFSLARRCVLDRRYIERLESLPAGRRPAPDRNVDCCDMARRRAGVETQLSTGRPGFSGLVGGYPLATWRGGCWRAARCISADGNGGFLRGRAIAGDECNLAEGDRTCARGGWCCCSLFFALARSNRAHDAASSRRIHGTM